MASCRILRLRASSRQSSVNVSTHTSRCLYAASRIVGQSSCNALIAAGTVAVASDERHKGTQVVSEASRKAPRSSSCSRPATGAASAAQLTNAIRACTSAAQLLALCQEHSQRFNHIHAAAALHQLVMLAPSTLAESGKNTPSSSDSATDPSPLESGSPATSELALQTGRLVVKQGQGPTLELSRQHQERLDSNYMASTSAPSSQAVQGRRGQAPDRSDGAGGRPGGGGVSHPPSAVDTRRLPGASSSNTSGGGGRGSGKGGRSGATGRAAEVEAAPGREEIMSAASGLVSILARLSRQLDGRGVATAAAALLRLQYADAALLARLEKRAIELLSFAGSAAEASAEAVASQGVPEVYSAARTSAVGIEAHAAVGQANGSGADAEPSEQSGRQSSKRRRDQRRRPDGKRRRQDEQALQHAGAAASEQRASLGMTSGELFAMILSFGALGHRPTREWLEAVTRATEPHLPAYAASRRDTLPALLYSLGNTGHRPASAWMEAACAAALPHLRSYSALELRTLVAGLSAMRHLPDDPWVAAYLDASEALLLEYTPADLAVTLSSLASLGCRPRDSWMGRFYSRVAELLGTEGGVNGPQAATIFCSLSKLNCRPNAAWLNTMLAGTRRSLSDASAQQLSDFVCALARVRFRPPEPWLQQFYAASFQRLPFFTPQQCCATAAAIARLGRRPQRVWLAEFGRQLGSKLSLMPGGQQCEAVAALVELGYQPAAAWLAEYEKHSNVRLAGCSAEELCRAVKALATVGFKPQASWLYAFITTVYSKLDAFDASQLALVFECLPALTPHGSWLDEIVQICAAEDTMRLQPAGAAAGLEAWVEAPAAELQEVQASQQRQRQHKERDRETEMQLASVGHRQRPLALATGAAVPSARRLASGEQTSALREVELAGCDTASAATAAVASGGASAFGSTALPNGIGVTTADGDGVTALLAFASGGAATDAAAPLDGASCRADAADVAASLDGVRSAGDGDRQTAAQFRATAADAAADADGASAMDGSGHSPDAATAVCTTATPNVADSTAGGQAPSGKVSLAVALDAAFAFAASAPAPAKGTGSSSTAYSSLAHETAWRWRVRLSPKQKKKQEAHRRRIDPWGYKQVHQPVQSPFFLRTDPILPLGASEGGSSWPAASALGSAPGLQLQFGEQAAEGVAGWGRQAEAGGVAVSGAAGGAQVRAGAMVVQLPGPSGAAVGGFTANGIVNGSGSSGSGSNGSDHSSTSSVTGRVAPSSHGRSDGPSGSAGGGGGGSDGSGGDGGASVGSGDRRVVVMQPRPARVPAAAVLATAAQTLAAAAALPTQALPSPLAVSRKTGASPTDAPTGDSALDPILPMLPIPRPKPKVVLQPKPQMPAAAAVADPASGVSAGSATGAAARQDPAAFGRAPGSAPARRAMTFADVRGLAASSRAGRQPPASWAAAPAPLRAADEGRSATDALPQAAGALAELRSPPVPGVGSEASPSSPESSGLAISTPATAAASAADERVQYLDPESLTRLIGQPDRPPGPDFSSCQKRAAAAAAGKRRGLGVFQLGRVWSNELLGGGDGPMPTPSPST